MTKEELMKLILNAGNITNEFLSSIHALEETKYRNLQFGDMIAYECYDKTLEFVYFMGAYKELDNVNMKESYEVICYDKERGYCTSLYGHNCPNIYKVDSFSNEYNGQCIIYQNSPGIIIDAVIEDERPVGYKLLLGDKKKWISSI